MTHKSENLQQIHATSEMVLLLLMTFSFILTQKFEITCEGLPLMTPPEVPGMAETGLGCDEVTGDVGESILEVNDAINRQWFTILITDWILKKKTN